MENWVNYKFWFGIKLFIIRNGGLVGWILICTLFSSDFRAALIIFGSLAVLIIHILSSVLLHLVSVLFTFPICCSTFLILLSIICLIFIICWIVICIWLCALILVLATWIVGICFSRAIWISLSIIIDGRAVIGWLLIRGIIIICCILIRCIRSICFLIGSLAGSCIIFCGLTIRVLIICGLTFCDLSSWTIILSGITSIWLTISCITTCRVASSCIISSCFISCGIATSRISFSCISLGCGHICCIGSTCLTSCPIIVCLLFLPLPFLLLELFQLLLVPWNWFGSQTIELTLVCGWAALFTEEALPIGITLACCFTYLSLLATSQSEMTVPLFRASAHCRACFGVRTAVLDTGTIPLFLARTVTLALFCHIATVKACVAIRLGYTRLAFWGQQSTWRYCTTPNLHFWKDIWKFKLNEV